MRCRTKNSEIRENKQSRLQLYNAENHITLKQRKYLNFSRKLVLISIFYIKLTKFILNDLSFQRNC